MNLFSFNVKQIGILDLVHCLRNNHLPLTSSDFTFARQPGMFRHIGFNVTTNKHSFAAAFNARDTEHQPTIVVRKIGVYLGPTGQMLASITDDPLFENPSIIEVNAFIRERALANAG